MGWITSAMASDGNRYDYFEQEKTNQCGPAAVATMLYYMKGKQIAISTISNWFKAGEGQGTIASDTQIRDFEAHGSWYNGVIAALSTLKIYAHATKGSVNAGKWIMKTEKKYKPAIVSVGWWVHDGTQWVRNGGHWILALKVHGNNVICLDPGVGGGLNNIVLNAPAPVSYTVDYGHGAQTGYVDGIILP